MNNKTIISQMENHLIFPEINKFSKHRVFSNRIKREIIQNGSLE